MNPYQAAIDHLSSHDELLATILDPSLTPGLSVNTEYYHSLVRSIISQQLSVKAAATIQERFIALFAPDPFPSPADILTKDIEELRAIGLSRQKASYIQDLALKVIEGTVTFDHLEKLTNEQIVKKLTQVKGIGVWTVHMFLMFSMGRQDVLPIGDLGIRNAVQRLYGLARAPTPEEITELAKTNKWHPYESVASWYLWRSLNNQPVIS